MFHIIKLPKNAKFNTCKTYSNKKCNNIITLTYVFFFHAVLVVEFEESAYTVIEGGTVDVCVKLSGQATFLIVLDTMTTFIDDSATGRNTLICDQICQFFSIVSMHTLKKYFFNIGNNYNGCVTKHHSSLMVQLYIIDAQTCNSDIIDLC